MAIITFNDIHGAEQTLDTEQKFNVSFNADCMEFLRACPDKCFDLIIADAPYGSGALDDTEHVNQRGRFDKYNDSSQTVNVEREREAETTAPIPRRGQEGPVEEVPGRSTTCTAVSGAERERRRRNQDRRNVG